MRYYGPTPPMDKEEVFRTFLIFIFSTLAVILSAVVVNYFNTIEPNWIDDHAWLILILSPFAFASSLSLIALIAHPFNKVRWENSINSTPSISNSKSNPK